MYKVAKGTRDLVGDEYDTIQRLIKRVEFEFKRNGGKPLETPVFERTDVLLGKYGEEADTKLIYKLADEGGEPLALRYDLTVPFVRYVKENGVKQMRRYSIGKVYRRDQPNVKSGRYREFYQADFDICGEKQEGMLAEATILNIASSVLTDLELDFKILVNDISNVQYMLTEIVGVDKEKWRQFCPAIDKLDKVTFSEIRDELVAMDPCINLEKLESALAATTPFNPDTVAAYTQLVELADAFGYKDRLVFTNGLARGLDYYTGFIWEFKPTGSTSSISAGGRYDDLLGVPTVGISIGLSRLLTFLGDSEKPVWRDEYFVTTIGDIPLKDKIYVVKWLQSKYPYAPVTFNFGLQDKKLGKTIADCCTNGIQYLVILAEREWATGTIIMKDLAERSQDLITCI